MSIDYSDFPQWENKVGEWRDATHNVPLMVREQIQKSKLNPDKVKVGPKSLFNDPLSLQFAMGYKDRRYSLSYDVLKRIPASLAFIAAILQTRCAQVAAFSTPYRLSKSLGFVVKHKRPDRETTKGEMEFIQSVEQFIFNCGANKPNPHSGIARDDFETFLKKIVRDSLIYDQATFEVVPDRKGMPYEFMAVDASTIRLASSTDFHDFTGAVRTGNKELQGWPLALAPNSVNARGPYRTFKVRNPEIEDVPAYVQLINGQIRNTYNRKELAFGVRNPRTDLYVQGYGYSELEQLITIVTSHINAEQFNARYFTQGSNLKGILNFKGENLSGEMLEAFKRQWQANAEGLNGAWRTPIIQSEQGVEWIDLQKTNQEMEFSGWIEYLVKIAAAVYMIDPAEINFDMKGGVTQTPLFESSSEWKLKASRDKGLKPLLKFVAKLINDNIVQKLDDHFMFDFVGLDELTEQEKHELRKEQIASYRTLNEIRFEEDMPPVPDGDIVLNPTYITYLQQKRQAELQEQQIAAVQGGGAGAAPEGGSQDSSQSSSEEQEKPKGPQYADNFTKAQSNTKILEISLDDSWIDSIRE